MAVVDMAVVASMTAIGTTKVAGMEEAGEIAGKVATRINKMLVEILARSIFIEAINATAHRHSMEYTQRDALTVTSGPNRIYDACGSWHR